MKRLLLAILWTRKPEMFPTMKQLKIQQTFFDMHSKVHEKVTKTPKCQKQRGT